MARLPASGGAARTRRHTAYAVWRLSRSGPRVHTCPVNTSGTPHGRDLPRRPVHFGPEAMEAHGGTTPGPAEVPEIAHQSAAVLVGAGRAAHTPEVTARLVALVDDLGLDTIAELWAGRPARSLPGVLWRLYAVREWVRRSPEQASREYAAGIRFTDVAHAVAGIPEPPSPTELARTVDQILSGVFEGDFAIALERAAAFCHVLAAGRAELAHDADATEPERAAELTGRAASIQTTARDLVAAAGLWRSGNLD